MPFVRDEPRFVRTLGALERVLYHYSIEHPRHFCVVAEIAGEKSPQDYRKAFDVIQRRHPMLSVYVGYDARNGPGFYRSSRQLNITFIACSEEPDWRRVVERELASPFPASEAPLMRVTVLCAVDRVNIVLCFHHAIADGLSAVYIIQDLMDALDGRTLLPLPVLAPLEILAKETLLRWEEAIETKLSFEADAEALRAIADRPLWRPFEGDSPIVSTITCDKELTALVRRYSKARGTTLHGAICAAVVCSATTLSDKDRFTITSPINLRTMLGLDERNCALLVAVGTVRFPVESHHDFWHLARQATMNLAQARTLDGVLNGIGIAEASVPAFADSKLASGLIGAIQYDAIVSNLGALALPTEVGSLRLEAFWGPAVQGRFINECMIGAASVGGRLRIMQTSPEHVPSFLEDLHQTLMDACTDE